MEHCQQTKTQTKLKSFAHQWYSTNGLKKHK